MTVWLSFPFCSSFLLSLPPPTTTAPSLPLFLRSSYFHFLSLHSHMWTECPFWRATCSSLWHATHGKGSRGMMGWCCLCSLFAPLPHLSSPAQTLIPRNGTWVLTLRVAFIHVAPSSLTAFSHSVVIYIATAIVKIRISDIKFTKSPCWILAIIQTPWPTPYLFNIHDVI